MADAPGQTELPKGSPEAPSQAPPSGVESQHKASTDLSRTATSSELAVLHMEVANQAMIDMVGTLKTNDNFDFQGNFDSAEEFEKNAYFINIQRGLREFLGSDKTTAPPQIKKAWIDACVNFIIAEIESYNNAGGAMGTPEVTLALDALKDPAKTGNSKQNGIGDFETWVTKSPHAAEYETWKAGQEQKVEAERTELGAQTTKQGLQAQLDALKATPEFVAVAGLKRVQKKLVAVQSNINNPPAGTDSDAEITALRTRAAETKAAYDKATALQARVNTPAMKNDVAPVALLVRVSDLMAKIAADGKDDLPQLSKDTQELDAEIAGIEKLIADYDTDEIPTGEKKRIFTDFKEGKRDLTKTREAFEQAKTTANAVADKADEEDVPFIDKATAFIDKMVDGPWKKTLGGLLAALTAGIVAMVKLPWIGDKFRGTAISNQALAKLGDEKAILAVKVEGEFKQFGLPRKFANALGGMKTAEVLKGIKEKPVADTKVQAKLEWLGKQLDKKGGATNEQSLFEFMDPEGDWKKGVAVQYKESDTAVAANQPPAPPATPGVAPAVAPVVATAPAGPPAVPPPGAVATAPQPPPSVG